MSQEDRDEWDAKADKDKARFEAEILTYKGPWKVLANTRTVNDPSAPKRPLPAFLAYSNSRRAALKRDNPDSTNAELSKMLSKSWKEAALPFREKFIEEAEKLRKNYKDETWEWQKRTAKAKVELTLQGVAAFRGTPLEMNRQRVANIAVGSHFQNSLIMQQLEQLPSLETIPAPISKPTV